MEKDNTRPRDRFLPQEWSELMRRAQAGDLIAYRQFLTEITPRLRSLAAAYCRNRADTEDVIQDILLSLHMARHTYDPKRPIGPWVTAIARHRIADLLRKRARHPERATESPLDTETFAAEDTNLFERGREARELREAIATLPAAQRQAVEMLKLRELSLKEASRESGMTISGLKAAMHRSLKSLRALLTSSRSRR